ncbi:hypothetical protein MB14_08935 [Roseivirga ehrenbergii]|uniref:Uncharacterized protein n=1 Tax=Roseivirga ehrenbergii (strain DSM 102268 / JCM 13514 / KCTC 12282 / NCIMB 14502 / KMM 6017) TaxID=279360 RepID=A0A150X0B5_ROSEK|nr:hypothetical protein MB14_08935 [Roseivirga ehrenbergii]
MANPLFKPSLLNIFEGKQILRLLEEGSWKTEVGRGIRKKEVRRPKSEESASRLGTVILKF